MLNGATPRTFEIDKRTYESPSAVRVFSKEPRLQNPESSIIEALRDELPSCRMLDIGVGGGRTTYFFAPRARRYVGIDYSQGMVAECRRKFQFDFRICDARDMHMFADSSFDFVLFSYNGIDYMDHSDRLGTLKEIHRVTRNGGKFCFSTHNLNYAPKLFSFDPLRPRSWPRAIVVRTINRSLTGRRRFSRFAVLNDGALRFRLLTYYIAPAEQLRQLEEHGFETVKAFDLGGGVIPAGWLEKATDPWVYYLCEKK